eukprot:CAMPEP_0119275198 /NCGR_PEP_ID=MMETSP1329-20130426/13409_1 /TAXON_ID=114041 /ORGANISM="Genus nov. species nov., Strain RCC1024" /LENGTH=179 /DNA_ID=CAMNT_0007275565 /DNA_START=69 /DNA_END=608 /DNA_ORIENTATION=+
MLKLVVTLAITLKVAASRNLRFGSTGCRLVATLGDYPPYSGNNGITNTVTGQVEVTEYADGIYMNVDLFGLEAPGSTGGIHIHAGDSCATHDDVLGHYWNGVDNTCAVDPDPWVADPDYLNAAYGGSMWVSDAESEFTGTLTYADFQTCGPGSCPVAGKVVVVHMADGTRTACGKLMYA